MLKKLSFLSDVWNTLLLIDIFSLVSVNDLKMSVSFSFQRFTLTYFCVLAVFLVIIHLKEVNHVLLCNVCHIFLSPHVSCNPQSLPSTIGVDDEGEER